MKRIITFITLSAILSWISSSHGQTITETVPPTGPTVVVIFTSSNGGPPIPTTIATLSGSSTLSSNNSKSTHSPSTSSRTSTSPSSSSSSTDADDSDPSTHHIPSPVAMIAGSLAGFIAILAAILVVCVTRKRRTGKRRRRRASIIRALEAQHGENLDRDGYPISDSGSLSVEEQSSTRRPGSTTRSTLRESGRSGKKNSTRGSGKHTAHVRVSPSDDVELDWRETDAGLRGTRVPSERHPIATPTSPTSTSTLTNSSSTATTLATPSNPVLDGKPKPIFGDVQVPRAHAHDQSSLLSSSTHVPPSPVLSVNNPHLAMRSPLSLPTAHKSDADLPPAYEDVR